jgi:hypothetical protein
MLVLCLPRINAPTAPSRRTIANPGYNSDTGVYYAGPPIKPVDSTRRIDELLSGFCWETEADRTNYIAMMLTTVLINKFTGHGAKPSALITANQPQLGKSKLASILSLLREGRKVRTMSYTPDDDLFENRLGAMVKRGATTIVVDNARSTREIASATLERSITDEVLCYRLLGKSELIEAPNRHLFVITANSPEISQDLIKRSVPVRLYLEGDDKRDFKFDPTQYAQDCRTELLAELLGMVERWLAASSPLGKYRHALNSSGWANIIGGILDVNQKTGFLASNSEVEDGSNSELKEFADLVVAIFHHQKFYFSASEMAEVAMQNKLLTFRIDPEHTGRAGRRQAVRMGIVASKYLGKKFFVKKGLCVALKKEKNVNSDGVVYAAIDASGMSPDT